MKETGNKSEAPIRIEINGPIIRIVARLASVLVDCLSVILSAFARCISGILLAITDIVEVGKDRLLRRLKGSDDNTQT